jgi:hypothetical protein
VLEEPQCEEAIRNDLAWLLDEKNPARYLEDRAGDSALADEALVRAAHLVEAAERAFRQAEHDGWPLLMSENPVVAAVETLQEEDPH